MPTPSVACKEGDSQIPQWLGCAKCCVATNLIRAKSRRFGINLEGPGPGAKAAKVDGRKWTRPTNFVGRHKLASAKLILVPEIDTKASKNTWKQQILAENGPKTANFYQKVATANSNGQIWRYLW